MQKYLPVLRSCPFFTGLCDDEILSILHCVSAAKITRPRGSYIFRAGDSTEVMGLMLSGSTLVIQEDLWGHRNILSKWYPDPDPWRGKWRGETVYYFYCAGDDLPVDFRMAGQNQP